MKALHWDVAVTDCIFILFIIRHMRPFQMHSPTLCPAVGPDVPGLRIVFFYYLICTDGFNYNLGAELCSGCPFNMPITIKILRVGRYGHGFVVSWITDLISTQFVYNLSFGHFKRIHQRDLNLLFGFESKCLK